MRVVGDDVVLVAPRLRRAHHLCQQVAPVGVGRVRVEVALDVGELDELRQLTASCGFELARVLAELGRDELIAEPLVHLLLFRELELLSGLDDGDRVLGDGQPVLHRALTERDVVILRAGEVLQQVAVRLGRDDTEVEAEALVRQDRRLRRPFCHHLDHPLQLREVVDQRLRIGRGRDDVEVAKGLLAPPGAAGLRHLHRRRMLPQHVDDCEQRSEPVAEQPPVGRLLLLFRERLQDSLLGLRAQARQRAQLLLLGRHASTPRSSSHRARARCEPRSSGRGPEAA